MKELTTISAKQTENIGCILAETLQGGEVICLSGDLGTGKTAFAGGIARAFGITDYITSPTFTIVNEYHGRMDLYHFDVYRIADPEEMFEIGFDEYLNSGGVVVIEWAEMIKGIIPDEHIWVGIEKNIVEGTDVRKICIDFKGSRYKDYIDTFNGRLEGCGCV